MMGRESESKYTVFLDGVPICPEKIVGITLTEGTPELENILPRQSLTFTVHIKTPKRWRCGSRKRFIKLMMSEGISRNYAEWLADFARTLMPYREAWEMYLYGRLFL